MPSRYPSEALVSAKYFVKQIPADRDAEGIIRRALARVWTAGTFHWTIGSGTSFNLAGAVGSYDVTYPVDWGRTIKADLVTGYDLANTKPLEIVSHIEESNLYVGSPSKIAFLGEPGLESSVRISPVPASLPNTQTVTSLYKRTCPVYTKGDIYTLPMPIPDDWYWVYEDAVLYEAYKYADDSRAGEARVEGDKVIYTGQLAVAYAGINEMLRREPLVQTELFPSTKDRGK